MAESVERGRRVRLPRGAGPRIQVFVNGVEQSEGTDFNVRGGEIVFTRPLVKEQVGRAQWLAMFLGLFGSYGRHETVDVHFSRAGRMEVVSDAEVLPDG